MVDVKSQSKAIRLRIAEATAALHTLQEECEHTFATYQNKANTGNYDPTADCYWREWKCDDCGKFWITDQDVWTP